MICQKLRYPGGELEELLLGFCHSGDDCVAGMEEEADCSSSRATVTPFLSTTPWPPSWPTVTRWVNTGEPRLTLLKTVLH